MTAQLPLFTKAHPSHASLPAFTAAEMAHFDRIYCGRLYDDSDLECVRNARMRAKEAARGSVD